MLIKFLGGSSQAAMLLSAKENVVRAALPGRQDVTEFHWAYGQWLDESGFPVEMEFDPSDADFHHAVEMTAYKSAEAEPEPPLARSEFCTPVYVN